MLAYVISIPEEFSIAEIHISASSIYIPIHVTSFHHHAFINFYLLKIFIELAKETLMFKIIVIDNQIT